MTPTFRDLVGELATHSEAFRTRWAAHDVRFPTTPVSSASAILSSASSP